MYKKIFVTVVFCLLAGTQIHAAQVKIKSNSDKENDIFQLTLAAESGNIDRLKELIAQKIDINAKDEGGWTALDWAIHGGSFEAAQYLMEREVSLKVDAHLKRILLRNDTKSAEILIACGANIYEFLEVEMQSCKNNSYNHPEDEISIMRFSTMVISAINAGFNINTLVDQGYTDQFGYSKKSLLSVACRPLTYSQNEHRFCYLKKLITVLLNCGADKSRALLHPKFVELFK
jgi:hypothetical protein